MTNFIHFSTIFAIVYILHYTIGASQTNNTFSFSRLFLLPVVYFLNLKKYIDGGVFI